MPGPNLLAENLPRYACTRCGRTYRLRVPRCLQCGKSRCVAPIGAKSLVPATHIKPAAGQRFAAGLPAWDAALGGGVWCPSSILLSGAPGAGKTTQALTVACRLAQATSRTSIVVTLEMTKEHLRSMADRLELPLEGVHFTDERNAAQVALQASFLRPRPSVVVWDSLPYLEDKPAKMSAITTWAHQSDLVSIAIEHITKSGEVAGTKATQHETDVVMHLGEHGIEVRKNRFGPITASLR